MSKSGNAVEDIYQELENTAKQELQNFKDQCTSSTDLGKLGCTALLTYKFQFMGEQIAIDVFDKTTEPQNAAIFADQKFDRDYAIQFLWTDRSFAFDLNIAGDADKNSKGETFELTDTQKLLTTLVLSTDIKDSPLYGIPGIVHHFVSNVALKERWENVLHVLS